MTDDTPICPADGGEWPDCPRCGSYAVDLRGADETWRCAWTDADAERLARATAALRETIDASDRLAEEE